MGWFFCIFREEDTESYKMRGPLLDKISNKIANKRRVILEDIQSEITPKRLEGWVGETMDVLIEEDVQKEDLYIGRGFLDAPEVDGLVVLKGSGLKEGDVVKAKILSVSSVDLIAEVVS